MTTFSTEIYSKKYFKVKHFIKNFIIDQLIKCFLKNFSLNKAIWWPKKFIFALLNVIKTKIKTKYIKNNKEKIFPL